MDRLGLCAVFTKGKKKPRRSRRCQGCRRLAPNFDLGRSVYAWALFDTIRIATEVTPDLLQRATKIVELTTNSATAYEGVSPFVPTVLAVARLLTRKARHHRVLEWLGRLDPCRLRGEEFAIVDPRGRPRKLASHRERYYGLKTHALERLERWHECLVAAQEAIEVCKPLHYDNDIWFARRIARSKVNLGSGTEGIAELEKLGLRKPKSFLYIDIAEAAWRIEDYDRALRNSLLALRADGDIGFKLAAVLLLARLLWRAGKEGDARLHLTFYIACRREKGWQVPPDVRALAEEWGGLPQGSDATLLLKQLQPAWLDADSSTQVRRVGVIEKVFHHGRAGFIRATGQERFFFDVRDWKSSGQGKLRQGVRITFVTKPSFDRKRGIPTVVACDIRSAGSNPD